MGVRLTRVLARAPGVAVSTVLTPALVSVLPGPLPWALSLAGVVTVTGLLAGAREPAAVRTLFGARALTAAERAALAPAIVLLCQRGLGPPLVRLWLQPGVRTVCARGAGRRSVLVSAELISQVRLGRLPPDQAAAVIAHAAGLVRVGAVRSEVALEVWSIPWRFLRGLGGAAADASGRLPLVRLMWRARFVVGLIALGQGRHCRPARGCRGRRAQCRRRWAELPRAPVGESMVRALQAIGDEQVSRAGLAPAFGCLPAAALEVGRHLRTGPLARRRSRLGAADVCSGLVAATLNLEWNDDDRAARHGIDPRAPRAARHARGERRQQDGARRSAHGLTSGATRGVDSCETRQPGPGAGCARGPWVRPARGRASLNGLVRACRDLAMAWVARGSRGSGPRIGAARSPDVAARSGRPARSMPVGASRPPGRGR